MFSSVFFRQNMLRYFFSFFPIEGGDCFNKSFSFSRLPIIVIKLRK